MSSTKVTPKIDVENPPSKSNDASSPPTKKLSLLSGGNIDMDNDDLEKLVPVLLEDASDGNVEAVRQVLELDAKTPNFSIAMATDDEGRHALHRAALEGQFEVLSLLLDRYKDTTNKKGIKYINVPDKYGNTPLFLVCIRLDKSDCRQAQYLMDCGASVDIVKKTDSMTVLHWASHHGNPTLVAALLNHHANRVKEQSGKVKCRLPYLLDKDFRTPVDVAGLQYRKKWVEEDDSMRGDSLLEEHVAVSSLDDYRTVIAHLSNPGLINLYKPSKKDWNRSLFWCAAAGHHVGVLAALNNGASARWKHPLCHSSTALHMAVEFGSSVQCVELIIGALMADKTIMPLYKMKDKRDNNPLHSFVLGTTNKVNEGDVDNRSVILNLLLSTNVNNKTSKKKPISEGGGAASPPTDAKSVKKHKKDQTLLESSRNQQGFRPVDYIPATTPVTSPVYQLLKTKKSPYYKDILENEPAIAFEWVVVFAKGVEIEGLDTQYNKVLKQLRKHDLLADLMPSAILPDKEVFVMVGCTESRLRQHAEDLEYEVQLLSSREYRKYEVEDDHLFLPFRSQERMEIIMKKMQDDVFDLDAYLECGVVLRTFPLHDPNERDLVSKLWLPKVYYWPFSCCCTKTALPPFSFCKDLRKEGSDLSFAHLTALKMYFGEKVAFYYAWYSHYTAYLAVAAVPGLIVLLVQVLQVLEMGTEGLRTPLIPFFCIWMAVWTTIQNEQFKRKASELAYRWDVMDAADHEELRPEFRGDECINTATGNIEKYHSEDVRRKKQYLSVPVVLTFVAAAIIAFISAKIYKETFAKGEYALYQGLVASLINSVAIVVLDQVYKRLAKFMTDNENHQYESEYESALVAKTFWFMLVNNTAPLCWAAFNDRNLYNLFKQTAITLVSKNLTNVAKDVVLPMSKSKKAQIKVNKALQAGSVLEKLVYGNVDDAAALLNPDNLDNLDKTDVRQAREEVIANAVLDGYGGIVGEYAEIVIQFAFVTLFACAFPGAPAIVLIINLIGIRGEICVSLFGSQRPETLTAGGIIEAWAGILEIIGYMAILCNVLILLFTFELELGWIQMNNVTTAHVTSGLPAPYHNISYNTTTLTNTSVDWWSFLTGRIRLNEVWAIVILEHILIMTKMGLSGCIEDTPGWVVDAVKRERWETEARAEMAQRKLEELQERNNGGGTKKGGAGGGGGSLKQMMGQEQLMDDILESVANFEPPPPPPPPPSGAGVTDVQSLRDSFVPDFEGKKE